jgi:cysteine synthase
LNVKPNTHSQEKNDALRLCGAELREVPAVPFRDPNHYVHTAKRTAEALAATEPHGVLYANQWDNLANRGGHLESTGPEIWTSIPKWMAGRFEPTQPLTVPAIPWSAPPSRALG